MIRENRNIIANYKEGEHKLRIIMIQENRNVFGKKTILVIIKKPTTK